MMRVRGGGDAAGAVQGGGTVGSLGTTGGGNDDDESEGRRTPGLPKRYEPMECTNVEDLKDLTLAALIGRGCSGITSVVIIQPQTCSPRKGTCVQWTRRERSGCTGVQVRGTGDRPEPRACQERIDCTCTRCHDARHSSVWPTGGRTGTHRRPHPCRSRRRR